MPTAVPMMESLGIGYAIGSKKRNLGRSLSRSSSGGTTTGLGDGGLGSPIAIDAPAPTPAALDFKIIYNGDTADPTKFNKKVYVFFFSCGTEPQLENPTALKEHQQLLIAAGITNSYMYVSPSTSHEWQTWRGSLCTFAPLLFR